MVVTRQLIPITMHLEQADGKHVAVLLAAEPPCCSLFILLSAFRTFCCRMLISLGATQETIYLRKCFSISWES